MAALPFLEYLRQIKLQAKNAELIVLGNQAADLDSIASALVFAWYLTRNHTEKRVVPLIAIPRQEMRIRPEAAFVFAKAGINPDDLLFSDDQIVDHLLQGGAKLVLVDHNCLENMPRFARQSVTAIIDHHHDQDAFPDATPRIINEVGSTATLIAELAFVDNKELDHPAALLLSSAILMDTVNLNDAAGRCTERDREMAEKLLALCKVDNEILYRELQEAQHDLAELSSQELLGRDYKEWPSPAGPYGMSTVLLSSAAWKEQESKLGEILAQFAARKNVHLLIVMLVSQKPVFKRELILFCQDEKLQKGLATYLSNQGLDLSALPEGGKEADRKNVLRLYRQGDPSISRKRLQPLVHSFLISGLPSR